MSAEGSRYNQGGHIEPEAIFPQFPIPLFKSKAIAPELK